MRGFGVVVAAASFVGVLIGSFLNVVVYRIPAGISIVKPPSACPRCGAEIRARDNIPVVSWLLLRGRCRACGEPISVRYPLVEGACGVLFGATAAILGWSWLLPAYLWFAALTLTLGIIDLDVKRIPNRVLYPGTGVAVVLVVVGGLVEGSGGAVVRALAGGAAYFSALLVVALVARGGFGMGDVKLAFLLGVFAAYRSWGSLVVAVFGGFVLGGLAAIVLLVARRAGRRDLIPFGPALVVGAWVAIAAGEPIVSWYLGL
ncbi:MAG TPA: prepilin peptidase [Acidimicrobiia bacterium]|nr:prepilin peptidase [Acidimicrobiia bacterium]